jgi:hypothetical protein
MSIADKYVDVQARVLEKLDAPDEALLHLSAPSKLITLQQCIIEGINQITIVTKNNRN